MHRKAVYKQRLFLGGGILKLCDFGLFILILFKKVSMHCF